MPNIFTLAVPSIFCKQQLTHMLAYAMMPKDRACQSDHYSARDTAEYTPALAPPAVQATLDGLPVFSSSNTCATTLQQDRLTA
jgi:hypothetical protein